MKQRSLIAVVGPCAAGKSTLVRALRACGYNAREVAQDHSYVPYMWQRITQPELLIYLDVSAEVALRRRPSTAGPEWWEVQAHRLRHAREHADLYINTDHLNPQEVLEQVLAFLHRLTEPSEHANILPDNRGNAPPGSDFEPGRCIFQTQAKEDGHG